MKKPKLNHPSLVLSFLSRWNLSALRRSTLAGSALVLFILPYLMGCDDDLFKIDWVENPDTALIYSLARPELNLLSAFDFLLRVPVQIESPNATGQWDIVVDTQEGQLVLLPPGALGVQGSNAKISPMVGMSYDEVRVAPSDTALYIGDSPVPLNMGSTYVIQTRKSRDFYGRSCTFFGKMEPLALDPVLGTVTFQFDVSPECNSRLLYPT
jgi:hypothetical protein